MIVVRVELWSARTGQKTELARMQVCNVGGTERRRDYSAATFRGRSQAVLDRGTVQKMTGLKGWPSLDLHVWNLIAAALQRMGYGPPAGWS